ncbi:MAG: hypothetical protein ABIL11_01665 [Chloroflexota bacterium]
MKKYFVVLMTVILFAWSVSPTAANAQTPTPPAATGEVTGVIVNQNQGTIVAESLEVMLHIWDEEYVELGMLHAQSQPDGTFRFTEVALEPGRLYAVMTIYDDVAYYSNTVPAVDGSSQLELDVPVYETTTDLSAVQIDQMHVLFDFAEDGLETTEIYIFSNQGERTVKDAVTLDDGQPATLRFPLPVDADFIFFQPDQQDRFVKFTGGFADTYPLMPGEGSAQIMVTYLTPFHDDYFYTYTAPVNIQAINFLLPEDVGVTLQGAGLSSSQPMTLNNGSSYLVYSYTGIGAGQTVQVSFSGKPQLKGENAYGTKTLPLALGGILLGLAMIGVGIWWWRRPEDDTDEETAMDIPSSERTLDDVISEIARLDDSHERGEVDEKEYRLQRARLRGEAKALLDRSEERS